MAVAEHGKAKIQPATTSSTSVDAEQELTYKSIDVDDRIRELEANGDLCRFTPKSRHPPRRCLFLTREAQKVFDTPDSAINLLCSHGVVRAAFTLWTLGKLVYRSGRKGGFLKRLEAPPPEVWEIRLVETMVQGRVFARFASPDTLVVTHMHTRGLLGSKGSRPWNDAMKNCVTEWDRLFAGIEPFSAVSIHDYVTSECDDFELK